MKKKTLQKTLGLALSMAMVLGMLTGCGNVDDTPASGESSKEESQQESKQESKQESTATSEEKAYEYKTGITLTLTGRTGATENWNDVMLLDVLNEKFGVTIEASPQPDDVWATKWNLMMAEEEVPDMATNTAFTLAEVSQWGADGYLLPIDEYLEHMPNLVAFFEAHPDYKDACTSPDGHIYGLQYYNENIQGNIPQIFINEDWLNRVGKEYPTNLDELYDVLKAFKEQDANGNGDPNDEYPFAWTEDYSRKALTGILNACGIVTQKNTSKCWGILEVSDDGEIYLADTTDNYRYFLKYMNKLWEEGLCLDTAYSVTKAEVQGMLKENLIGVMSESTVHWQLSEDDFNPSARWEYLGGLTSDVNDVPIMGATNYVSDNIKMMIGADTEYPEEVCRLVDFFFTEEGIRAAKTYDWYAENYEEIGSKYYYDKENPSFVAGLEDYPIYSISKECDNTVPDGFDTWANYFLQKAYINEGFNMVAYNDPNGFVNIMINNNFTDEQCDAVVEAASYQVNALRHKRMNEEGEVVIKFGYPIIVYGEDVTEERNSIWNDIFLLCQTAQAQFITGEKDPNNDADWNAFLENLNKAKLERLLEIEQTSYDAGK